MTTCQLLILNRGMEFAWNIFIVGTKKDNWLKIRKESFEKENQITQESESFIVRDYVQFSFLQLEYEARPLNQFSFYLMQHMS